MRKSWDALFGLDDECSVWIDEDDLGKERLIKFRNKQCKVVIPQAIDKNIVLRLRGRGKTRGGKTGDLLLHLWLNKGEDIRQSLWISESSARNGADKRLFLGEKTITMVIPPRSYQGLTIRLRGYGKPLDFDWRAPFLRRKPGHALVKLVVYPDAITPDYGSFETLSTEDMALEGWVYRKFDEVIQKLGRSALPRQPIPADEIANLFNAHGWTSIFYALVRHLNLAPLSIEPQASASLSVPGRCERRVFVQNNTSASGKAIVPGRVPAKYAYNVTIHEQFLDNPFAVAAILAHELCHVVYSERMDTGHPSIGYVVKSEKATLEEEHTVDLLVFMFRIGEFQLRVARDKRLTLGYFNQEIFERIQVIVSKKLHAV
jgi:hypothetical protein